MFFGLVLPLKMTKTKKLKLFLPGKLTSSTLVFMFFFQAIFSTLLPQAGIWENIRNLLFVPSSVLFVFENCLVFCWFELVFFVALFCLF